MGGVRVIGETPIGKVLAGKPARGTYSLGWGALTKTKGHKKGGFRGGRGTKLLLIQRTYGGKEEQDQTLIGHASSLTSRLEGGRVPRKQKTVIYVLGERGGSSFRKAGQIREKAISET